MFRLRLCRFFCINYTNKCDNSDEMILTITQQILFNLNVTKHFYNYSQ